MRIRIFVMTSLMMTSSAYALVGVDELAKSLYQKNREIAALEKVAESKESLRQSADSGFYPTLNVVGGWGKDDTAELAHVQKGYFGYAEGKLNLFRGFKDQSIQTLKELDVKISRLDVELKKRELRVHLIEVATDMIFLHKVQSILDEEYKTIKNQKLMAAKKIAAGLTGQVDDLEFVLRENEIEIEQKQIDQKHLEAHQRFIKLFGEDISDADIEKITFSDFENLKQVAGAFKIEKSTSLLREQLLEERTRLEVREIKADYLPTLDFTYNYGRITPSETSSAEFNESKISLQLTVPLFSGLSTYYNSRASTAVVDSVKKIKLQKNTDLQTEFESLKSKAAELSFLYQINEKKLVNSQKYFDLTLTEYKRGIKNSPDLVNATERLFLSKKKKFELLKDLEVTQVKIENLF